MNLDFRIWSILVSCHHKAIVDTYFKTERGIVAVPETAMVSTSGQDGFKKTIASTESHLVETGAMCDSSIWPEEYPDWVQGSATAKLDGKNVVCGGGDYSSCYVLDKDFDSDHTKLQWSRWTDMSDSRRHHAMIGLSNSTMWVLGGANKYAPAMNTTEYITKVYVSMGK